MELQYKSFEKKSKRMYSIEWFYGIDGYESNYKVQVTFFNRLIYTKKLDKKHYLIYKDYIEERVNYLIGEHMLYKDYSMILLDNTMYKVIDATSHHKELLRALIPVGAIDYHELKDQLFDLVLDCTLRTGEIYDDEDLVYHNGIFYTDGMILCSIKDFDRVGIEYEPYDLLQGLNDEQWNYIHQVMYYNLNAIKVKKYCTSEVRIKINY